MGKKIGNGERDETKKNSKTNKKNEVKKIYLRINQARTKKKKIKRVRRWKGSKIRKEIEDN